MIGDLLTEGDETFFVTLTSAVGGAIVRPQGTGTIFDEEANTPPVASDILRNIGEDGVLTFSPGTFIAAYSDAENDPLRSVRIQSLPSNGTLRFNNTAVTLGQVITANDLFSLTYTPNANYFGSDSFNYQAFDRIAFSNVARVNINVNPINDLPTISNLANRRINRKHLDRPHLLHHRRCGDFVQQPGAVGDFEQSRSGAGVQHRVRQPGRRRHRCHDRSAHGDGHARVRRDRHGDDHDHGD